MESAPLMDSKGGSGGCGGACVDVTSMCIRSDRLLDLISRGEYGYPTNKCLSVGTSCSFGTKHTSSTHPLIAESISTYHTRAPFKKHHPSGRTTASVRGGRPRDARTAFHLPCTRTRGGVGEPGFKLGWTGSRRVGDEDWRNRINRRKSPVANRRERGARRSAHCQPCPPRENASPG